MTIFRFFILAPMLLVLVGCGDGWETRPYEGIPYGHRTAGNGIEYVRAVMKQEKGPVLRSEIQKTKSTAKVEKKQKLEDAAPIFDNKQRK